MRKAIREPKGIVQDSCNEDRTRVGEEEIFNRCRVFIRVWAQIWKYPGLEDTISFEVSHRLYRSIARVQLQKRIIRLSSPVSLDNELALREILCHEVAHIVAFERHGRNIRPHGKEWAELMRTAGYEARIRINPKDIGIKMPKTPNNLYLRKRYTYEHRCPVCQVRKTAGRPVRQWRCVACVDAGLTGELEITRSPTRLVQTLLRNCF